MAVAGHFAYTTGYFSGRLVAVDLSDPAHPKVAGMSPEASALVDGATVNVSGGYAYVVSKNRNASPSSDDDGTGNSLTILDIHTDPAAPAIVGSIHDPKELFGAYGVAVQGGYALVAAQGVLSGQPTVPDTGTGSFAVINVSNPAVPTIVGHLDNNALPSPWSGSNALQHVCSVFVSGHYAYVTAAYSNRLTVIDISDPSNPTIVGSSSALAFPVDLAVAGHYAYVADQTPVPTHPNFAVVNVANPSLPRLVGSLTNPKLSGAYRIRVRGKLAYVAAAGTATVAAVDISKPTHPVLAATVTNAAHLSITIGLDTNAKGAYVVASSALLADQPNPIYPPFPPAPGAPTLTGTITTIKLDPVRISIQVRARSEPPSQTTRTSATFRFSTSDAVATVSCKLDRAPLSPCGSRTTQRYRSLRPGRHRFTVQATNAAGKTASATYGWTVGT